MPTLRDLGLSAYEARAYRSLLATGPTSAKELSRTSDVPMGRIYDVLGDLESAGLVRSQAAGRPKKYAAVEPETGLDRLLADRRRELEAELRQYESTVEELSDTLDAGEPAAGEFWTVAVGLEDTVDLLEERLAAATDRIVMVAAEPSSGLDLGRIGDRVASQFTAALDRGVDVSVLVDASLVSAVPAELLRRYRSPVLDHPAFDVRVSDDVSGVFTLVDGVEVCIEVPNPLAPDQPFALIDVTDPAFAADVYAEFEPRWTNARAFADA